MSQADFAAASRAFEAGDLSTARAAARRAAAADQGNLEACAIWGIAAAETGALDEAIEPLSRAARHLAMGAPGAAPIQVLLARCLAHAGLWRQALEYLEPHETRPPADPILRARLGTTLVAMQCVERGLTHLRAAADARPDAPDVLYHLGSALASLGRFDQAEACFETALAAGSADARLTPAHLAAVQLAPIHLALARLRRWTPERNHLDRLRAIRLATKSNPGAGAALHFALFKELDDLGLTEQAWETLATANLLAGQAVGGWSPKRDRALIAALMRRFPTALLDRARSTEDASGPIFIVGLPRTGTTLVERILGAHSQVRALGELPFFPNLLRAAAGGREPILTAAVVDRMKAVDWRALGAAYLEQAAAIAGGQTVFTDKTPFNSLLIGPLRLALPNARIVLLSREPMDALFSAHRMWLPGDDAYRWSHRLEDLADHFRGHQRLMNHWRAGLGGRLIEVSYETLVDQPQAEIRRLLAACGLAFEEACLRPEAAPGAIQTLSSAQARAPIGTASVGGWRRYEAQLAPLRARLGL